MQLGLESSLDLSRETSSLLGKVSLDLFRQLYSEDFKDLVIHIIIRDWFFFVGVYFALEVYDKHRFREEKKILLYMLWYSLRKNTLCLSNDTIKEI